ncbi:MAG: polyphosphate polymerase domain-containing protein [Alistipes sp.]|nr:polyphosphate polymerase domain-containing protein [Alistipes sp.]
MTYEQLNNLRVWEQMPTITLDEMSSIKLMNRVDTKYVMHEQQLEELLQMAVEEYSVQIIGDVRACRYNTLYYDTADYDMYTRHHNQQLTRQKIRTRCYEESGQYFIEVKNKTNKGRTKKKRITIPASAFADVTRNAAAEAFLREKAAYAPEEIEPALTTTFDRITLVNNAHTERLTIDANLRFGNLRKASEGEMKGLVIVELKQDGMYFSPMKKILQRLRIKPFKVSKYCLGTVLTEADVKQNRFKRKVRMIEKMLKD